jgi:hypothetical protein
MRRTIHQPWAQVALEGLRRMDEGIAPNEAFPEGYDVVACMEDAEGANEIKNAEDDESENVLPLPKRARTPASADQAPLSLTVENAAGGGRRMMVYGAVAAAVIISVAAVGFPAGWYSKKKVADAAQPTAAASTEQQVTNNTGASSSDQPAAEPADPSAAEQPAGPVNDSAALAARREREARDRERWKAAQEKADTAAPGTTAAPNATADAAKKPEPAKPKTTTVQVTYDEAGRVTQASGGDANALRIARQKRFPAGKAGAATVTIPVN